MREARGGKKGSIRYPNFEEGGREEVEVEVQKEKNSETIANSFFFSFCCRKSIQPLTAEAGRLAGASVDVRAAEGGRAAKAAAAAAVVRTARRGSIVGRIDADADDVVDDVDIVIADGARRLLLSAPPRAARLLGANIAAMRALRNLPKKEVQ